MICDDHRKGWHGASWLRDLRKQRGWTLEAVAYLAGVDQGTVSRVERGLVEPTPETTVALARTYGISIAPSAVARRGSGRESRVVIPDPAEQPTVPLWPTAGQAFGLGRARTFELARRGELPFEVYRLGRSWRVPTAALRRALHLDPGGGDE